MQTETPSHQFERRSALEHGAAHFVGMRATERQRGSGQRLRSQQVAWPGNAMYGAASGGLRGRGTQ